MELQRRRALIDERSASLAAKVNALEHENSGLRRQRKAAERAAEFEAVKLSIDRLLRKVAGSRGVDVP